MPIKSSTEKIEAFEALYELGWNDRKASKALDVTPSTIRNWRDERGLRANGKPNSIDFKIARRLYSEGWLDTEIAKHFGVTQSGVTRWRQRNNLKPNPVEHRVSDQQRRTIKRMLREGGSARAVSEAIGFSEKTILKVRNTMPAEGLRGMGHTVRAQRRRIAKSPGLLDELKDVLGRHLPSHILDHAAMDMISDLYEGRLQDQAIRKAAPRYRSAAYNMCGSTFEHARLDATNDDGFSLADTLTDKDWERAFDFDE